MTLWGSESGTEEKRQKCKGIIKEGESPEIYGRCTTTEN